ncbi:MAG: haloacid dehalogenase-like hydrolase [Sphaerochaeta sp.]|nr:haloacid dehalogenase-like hydrolase [Sphaerochaeta sp.]
MQKKFLITFDFDGTFYPLYPYDSEQRLILSTARVRGHLNRVRAKRMVLKDRQGEMALGEFNRRYHDLLSGCTHSQIEEVAKELFNLVDPKQYSLLKDLSTKADLAILSCGTENIIRAFLSLHKIDHHFFQVSGKSLHFNKGSKPDIVCTIGNPEEKRAAFATLKKNYVHTIAIGDGPTDIPMLEEAELGLIIDWSGEDTKYPFETYSDLHSALERCLTYLEKAEEA